MNINIMASYLAVDVPLAMTFNFYTLSYPRISDYLQQSSAQSAMLDGGTYVPVIFVGRSKTSGMKLTLTQIFLIALSVVSIALFLRLWLGTGSYPEIWDLKGQIAEQQHLNEEQTKRNERLQSDVLDISRDDAVIEDRARSELGMIKKNETYYQVILNSDPSATATNTATPPPAAQPHAD